MFVCASKFWLKVEADLGQTQKAGMLALTHARTHMHAVAYAIAQEHAGVHVPILASMLYRNARD
jgi:hypothetical protein